MRHLNQEKAEESDWSAASIPVMQAAVYVMCGGGFLGQLAAEKPMDFYIDERCRRLPYSRNKIYQAVENLKAIAVANDIDLRRLPKLHNTGIFFKKGR